MNPELQLACKDDPDDGLSIEILEDSVCSVTTQYLSYDYLGNISSSSHRDTVNLCRKDVLRLRNHLNRALGLNTSIDE